MTDTSDCDWCDDQHPPDHLCPPAKTVLDGIKAKGDSITTPFIELPRGEGVDGTMEGYLCAGLRVTALVSSVLGAERPGIGIHPVLVTGQETLPLLYFGTDEQLRDCGRLFFQSSASAIKRAQERRAERKR